MAKTKVVVEISGDEQRVLDSFRKAQAADEDLRASVKKTGDASAAAAKEFVDGWVKGPEKATRSTNQWLAALRKGGTEGVRIFQKMQDPLTELGLAGKKSIDEIMSALETVNPEVAAVATKAREELAAMDRSDAFERTRQSIAALGGDFAILGKEIKKATDAPMETAEEAAKRMVRELMQIDPTKAQQIAKALDNASEAINAGRLDEFVKKLGMGSKESQALAKAIGVDMKQAALDAEGGIEGIANKIVTLRPELKSTVDQWRTDMAEAAKFGEGQYEKALNALRSGDSVSKEVAKKIKQHLVDSGKIVEKSFEEMIKPLEQIDPEAAEQARKMKAHFDDMEKAGSGSFATFGKKAIAEILAVVAAYAGLQEAIQFVSQLLKDQQNLLKGSADRIKEFAVAKEQAQMNLSDLPENVRVDLMNNFVKEVIEKSAVSDPGSIATAIGDSISAGATVPQAKSAVTAASMLNPLNPDKIPAFAGAFVDVQRATGVVGAELAASQMLLAGTQSRVVVPQKLFRNAAPVAATAADTAGGARREEGALEGLALFAAFSKAATDTQGDASQTASIQLTKRMESFFEGLGQDASKARAELAKLKQEDPLTNQQRLMLTKLSKQEGQQQQSDAEVARLEKQLVAIQDQQDAGGMPTEQRRQLGIQKRKLKEQLAAAKDNQFTQSEAAQLADLRSRVGEANNKFQEKVAGLQGKIAAENIKGFNGKLPETIGDMFRALQENPELQAAFLADKFGEQRFRSAIRSSVSGGEVFSDFTKARGLLFANRGKTDKYQEQLRITRETDPATREAINQQRFEAAEISQKIFNTQGGGAGSFRNEIAKVLAETRSDGIDSAFQYIGEIGVGNGVLLGGEIGSQELLSGLQRLTTRLKQNRQDFGSDGFITQHEQSKLGRLEDAIEATLNRFDDPTIQGDPNLRDTLNKVKFGNQGSFRDPGQMFAVQENESVFRRLEAILTQQLQLMEEQLKSSRGTERNTSRRNGNPQQDATAAANGRAGR